MSLIELTGVVLTSLSLRTHVRNHKKNSKTVNKRKKIFMPADCSYLKTLESIAFLVLKNSVRLKVSKFYYYATIQEP